MLALRTASRQPRQQSVKKSSARTRSTFVKISLRDEWSPCLAFGGMSMPLPSGRIRVVRVESSLVKCDLVLAKMTISQPTHNQ